MDISFFNAKNNLRSCKINDINLHSSYNPEIEAQRFVNAISNSFDARFIVITEPALSYCAKFLRNRFPNAIICAIRYTDIFSETDKEWDNIFYYNDNIAELLYSKLGEEGICSTIFLSWKESEKAFPKINKIVWKEIKNVVLKSRDVLFTRSVFSSRWIYNSFFLCKNIKKISKINSATAPVVITASGRSLENTLPFLKQHRKYIFIIALSSSISVLLENKITPDLCFSTDGSFYANAHLKKLLEYKDIPLALASEAYCCGDIISNCNIIPLTYKDGFASELLNECKIQSMQIERNGTVSGSAIDFAMNITSGYIFICGLDLSRSLGFQHTQPNMLEINDSQFDNRIMPKETRIAKSNLNSNSLKIYCDWFKSISPEKYKNVFRLSDNFNFANTINIKDANISFFESCINHFSKKQTIVQMEEQQKENITEKERLFLTENSNTDKWLHEIFPADFIFYTREKKENEKIKKANILEEKNNVLISKIRRLTK